MTVTCLPLPYFPSRNLATGIPPPLTLPTSRPRLVQTKTQFLDILRTLSRQPLGSNSSPSTLKRQGPTTPLWSTSSRCLTKIPRTSSSSQRPLCIHIVGPCSKRSAIGATKYTTTRPTPRPNRTAFRKPASPFTSPTQTVGVGWYLRRKPLGHLRCRTVAPHPTPYLL